MASARKPSLAPELLIFAGSRLAMSAPLPKVMVPPGCTSWMAVVGGAVTLVMPPTTLVTPLAAVLGVVRLDVVAVVPLAVLLVVDDGAVVDVVSPVAVVSPVVATVVEVVTSDELVVAPEPV